MHPANVSVMLRRMTTSTCLVGERRTQQDALTATGAAVVKDLLNVIHIEKQTQADQTFKGAT